MSSSASIDHPPEDGKPRKNAWKMGLGLALVTGQVLVFMPNKVAGQGQGERTPASATDTVCTRIFITKETPYKQLEILK